MTVTTSRATKWKSAFRPQNWAPLPQRAKLITYVGPGIGEIKPHVGESICDGLEQLRMELADPKMRPLTLRPEMQGLKLIGDRKWLKNRDVVLVTYVYTSAEKEPASPPETREFEVPARGKLKVFALRPHAKFMEPPTREERAAQKKAKLQGRVKNPGIPSKIPPYPKDPALQPAWRDSLGIWYAVDDAKPPSHPYPYWLTSLGPAGRGTAFEPAVRQAFIATLKPKAQPETWVKFPSAKGADVVWREVAEYLYELAGELTEGR